MRQLRVVATWRTVETLEVEDDAPRIVILDDLLEAGLDLDSSTAELWDWDIHDDGPA